MQAARGAGGRGANVKVIGGLTCPAHVKEQVTAYVSSIGKALGGDLIGVYLYGSLARGCFHPATSDVDVVGVTGKPCTEDEIAQVVQAHRRAQVSVDATFATTCQIKEDVTPTPVDFVVKPLAEGGALRLPEGHRDFLLQRQEAYECDIGVFGPSARQVMGSVPWPRLAECLDLLFPFILPRFKNPALMLCRAAYAFTSRRLCSKKEAGEWGLRALDKAWHSLLSDALCKYRHGIPDDRGEDEALRRFEEYCVAYIAQAREGEQNS